MTPSHHMVMRQIMDLVTASQESAFNLQQRMGEYCRNVMPALLNQVCTRCDGGDRVFKVDRLEIDLGRVSSEHLEEEISEKLAQLLYEALRDRVDRISLQYDSRVSSGGSQPSIRGSPRIFAGSTRDRMISLAQADLERILYFLETGYLPWSTMAGTVELLEKTLARLVATEPDMVDTILVFVADRPVARRRLITQFSEDLLWSIARHGSPDSGQRLKSWKHVFDTAVAASGFEQPVSIELRDSFWSVAYQYLPAISGKSIAAVEFWQQVFSAAAERSGQKVGTLITTMIEGAQKTGDPSVILKNDLLAALEQLIERVGSGGDEPRGSTDLPPSSVLKADKQTLDKISGRPLRPEVKARPEGVGDQTTTVDRQDRKDPLPAALRDIEETETGGSPSSRTSTEQMSGAGLEEKSEVFTKPDESETVPHSRDDLTIDREKDVVPSWRAGDTMGPEPEIGSLADHTYPEIRFDIKPEPGDPFAGKYADGDGGSSWAEKQPLPSDIDQLPSAAKPARIPFSAPALGSARASKEPGSFDADLEKKSRITPAHGELRAGAVSIDGDSHLSDRPDRKEEGDPKSAAGYSLRPGDYPATASDKMPTSEKAENVYLSGIDADTALREIYVDNAGLVIVWPFMTHIFKTLSLLEENNFVDDRSKARAIYLLQYLATGKEEFPEFVLPLNKLLCGWEIGTPLGREYRLTDFEKTESQKLLEAVISHWTALKQTSVDGLRTSFLQRNAVLIETMRHWLLRVERQPHDMLLERLPWGLSMIRLSWMQKMLNVEW